MLWDASSWFGMLLPVLGRFSLFWEPFPIPTDTSVSAGFRAGQCRCPAVPTGLGQVERARSADGNTGCRVPAVAKPLRWGRTPRCRPAGGLLAVHGGAAVAEFRTLRLVAWSSQSKLIWLALLSLIPGILCGSLASKTTTRPEIWCGIPEKQQQGLQELFRCCMIL